MHARRFPKILISLALFTVAAGSLYLFAIKPDTESFHTWFCGFGEFICKYDNILIGFLVAINLLELIDMLIFAKRDEVINAQFEAATKKSIGIGTLFLHYFSGIFCQGPLIFAKEERSSAPIRIIITLVTTITKFAAWLLILVSVIGMSLRPEVYEFAMNEGADYAFTVFVLYLFLNCNVLVYALYRILPLHETRTYDVIYYYSDGSSSRGKTHSSNFIAILFLTGIIYVFNSSYYILTASSRLTRVIETARFTKHLDSTSKKSCIWNFYGTR